MHQIKTRLIEGACLSTSDVIHLAYELQQTNRAGWYSFFKKDMFKDVDLGYMHQRQHIESDVMNNTYMFGLINIKYA